MQGELLLWNISFCSASDFCHVTALSPLSPLSVDVMRRVLFGDLFRCALYFSNRILCSRGFQRLKTTKGGDTTGRNSESFEEEEEGRK